jgi:hypothetical protein
LQGATVGTKGNAHEYDPSSNLSGKYECVPHRHELVEMWGSSLDEAAQILQNAEAIVIFVAAGDCFGNEISCLSQELT